MSNQNKGAEENPLTGPAIIVGIICAIAGYHNGEWPLAIIAGLVGFGAVFMAVRILGLAISVLIGAAILFVLLAIFTNNLEFLGGLFQ